MGIKINLLMLFTISLSFSQTTINPNTGDAYLLFGPNTNWGQYLQVGGNGRVTSHASIFATNGNLHLDSKNGSFSTYINYYSMGNTILNGQGGYVGIGVTPQEKFQISTSFVFHSGGHDVLGFQYKPSGGVDLSPDKYSAEIRFDPINGFLRFGTSPSLTDTPITRFSISKDGKVGIGNLDTGNHRLAVEGSIGAREVKVEASGWSDFVFEENYVLPTLEEVEKHIKEHGHLKDIPSSKDVRENGILLGEMDAKLLQKIEELTLYTIQQEEELKTQKEKIIKLEKMLNQLLKKNK